jgi:hypothetical protein
LYVVCVFDAIYTVFDMGSASIKLAASAPITLLMPTKSSILT